MVNKVELVETYLKSWGNSEIEIEYYLSLSDWEEYFSFLWND